MSAQSTAMDMAKHSRSRTRTIIGVGIFAFLVIAICAFLLCFTYLEYQIQSILNRQRDVQQTMLDKSLDAIRVWRQELSNQARFISSSEMFRIFITDTRDLSAEQLRDLADPELLNSPNSSIRALAEQRAYMQDLLRDFIRRRAWIDATLVTTDGVEILAPQKPAALDDAQQDLVKRAVENKASVFGPIRKVEGAFFMDMADPLFEVLGGGEPKCVAVLLLTVPMNKPLSGFLTNNSTRENAIYPRLVDQTKYGTELIMLAGNNLVSRKLSESVAEGNLAFERRPALVTYEAGSQHSEKPLSPDQEVYSLGARPTLLDWLLVLETPATIIEQRIRSREWEIYGLGALTTIGLTLLAAFLFANMTSRQHKARAAHLNNLYNTIRQQKLVLDGVNNSLEAGLLLVDDKGVIQIANPAFRELTHCADKDLRKQPLVDVLPPQASIELIGNMKTVEDSGQSKTIELQLPGEKGERLFRVTLFPYQSESGEATSSGSGCVAIFQDITQFRANAKKAAKRQEALLTAMDRAIESADPHLVGQSAKMAQVSKLLADKLGMDAAQKETLRIASLLSQIGKLFVPRELLLKQGKLTPEEKSEVARAPEHADRILSDLSFDLPVRETVGEISERVDGSGPRGLKGDQLSKAGKLLAAVNAFIAMTSARSWRAQAGMPIDKAIETLSANAGFDPEISKALGEIDAAELAAIVNGKQA